MKISTMLSDFKRCVRSHSTSLAITATLVSAIGFSASAEEFVVTRKPGKIFDEPNAKGYVTLNSKNEEVAFIPGMVFKSLESSKGWHMVEYSPGLRGYVSAQSMCKDHKMPTPGIYKVANNSAQQLKAELSGDTWKATVNDKVYSGKIFGNAVVFFNDNKEPAYSLVDLGEGGIAVSYDNTKTKFF